MPSCLLERSNQGSSFPTTADPTIAIMPARTFNQSHRIRTESSNDRRSNDRDHAARTFRSGIQSSNDRRSDDRDHACSEHSDQGSKSSNDRRSDDRDHACSKRSDQSHRIRTESSNDRRSNDRDHVCSNDQSDLFSQLSAQIRILPTIAIRLARTFRSGIQILPTPADPTIAIMPARTFRSVPSDQDRVFRRPPIQRSRSCLLERSGMQGCRFFQRPPI